MRINNILALVILMCTACSEAPPPEVKLEEPASSPPAEEIKPTVPEIPAGRIYVQKVMDACGARMSEAKRSVLSEQIRMVGESLFLIEAERKWFYLLICIESRFNNAARSTAGAVGLTQVMPRYAPEFARACGLGELDPADLADSQVNLLVGACRFKELMVYYEGDPTLALAAYNSGRDSPTVRKAASSDVRSGHPETVGYLAAAFVMNQRVVRELTNEPTAAQKTAQLRDFRRIVDEPALGVSAL